MTTEEFRQICDLANDRNEKKQAWLRQLLVIASAALTALVAFRSGDHSVGMSLWSLRIGWVALGLGILLGAFSLHGEVWIAHELTRRVLEQAKSRSVTGATGISPVGANLPARYRAAKGGFCGCLILAVLALVTHAVLS